VIVYRFIGGCLIGLGLLLARQSGRDENKFWQTKKLLYLCGIIIKRWKLNSFTTILCLMSFVTNGISVLVRVWEFECSISKKLYKGPDPKKVRAFCFLTKFFDILVA
jgi:hypothetical protein